MAVDADDRQFGGNDGYTDEPDAFYSWDSRVPRSRDVQPGDRVVLWNKHQLIGASVVEGVEVGEGPKTSYRCKECGKASIKRRKAKRPFFRCHNQNCKAEFDDPITETVRVLTYRSVHAAAWVPLPGLLSGEELRKLCAEPESQHAIRPLNWDAFAGRVAAKGRALDLVPVDRRAESKSTGHKQVLTRVRIGQASFRKQLLDRFGETCALTGSCPNDVLEAGHLYSYAKVGQHHRHGGLLLRRDVHRLLDRGKLAVDPELLTVSVDEELLQYPAYAALDGRHIEVPVSDELRKWLREHWSQHRTGSTYLPLPA
jgi:HNH endonuclease